MRRTLPGHVGWTAARKALAISRPGIEGVAVQDAAVRPPQAWGLPTLTP
jgi:hypothetical protein